MKKKLLFIPLLTVLLHLFSGFVATGEKTGSISVVYGVAAVLSACVFLIYIFGAKKKSPWFILLFSSVFFVNIGYLSLAISKTLEEALLANRISYLGSVFLPMAMLFIILEVTKTEYRKWFLGVLIGAGIVMFIVAASPGYLDIYYKEVSLVTVNGVSLLNKIYGPLHILYLFYLLFYFSAMAALTVMKTVKKKTESPMHAAILLFAVFINITVWLLEQFVKIDFEILSVSYVVTEVFLLMLCFLMQENAKQLNKQYVAPVVNDTEALSEKTDAEESENAFFEENDTVLFFETEQYKNFMYGLGTLTNTEHKIYTYYLEGKSTKEVLELLSITENTLKYHNKNIYGKLGVSSRKQLKEIAFKIKNVNR